MIAIAKPFVVVIITKTTDKPLDPEKRQKEEATRKKFELLRFGEHKCNPSELLKMNHWRYCYCTGVVEPRRPSISRHKNA